ncbi:caspase family protein [Streptomyces sp. N2A]|uniref:caspase family protein n=1 Tax=Streptomyces sp. N2A TaxID=3073936 RepID=UPI002870082F|nr:caspase family protein [Streptomyces sp. N2A]
MPTGLSLHVGLNQVDPARYGGWDGRLVACENDAHDMAALARGAGFAPTVLLTADGTVERVTAELRKAAKTLKSGDILLLTYSGHGGQVPNTTGGDDEADRFDETLVLYDREFLDDELHREFGRFARGVRLLVVLDCCHSGTAVEMPDQGDGEYAARLMPPDRQYEIYRRDQEFFQEIQRELGARKSREPAADAVLLAACQDNQLASDGDTNGKFTGTLLDVWNGGAFRGGYRTFHRDIQRGMPPTQSPNLYTTGNPDPAFLDQQPFTV